MSDFSYPWQRSLLHTEVKSDLQSNLPVVSGSHQQGKSLKHQQDGFHQQGLHGPFSWSSTSCSPGEQTSEFSSSDGHGSVNNKKNKRIMTYRNLGSYTIRTVLMSTYKQNSSNSTNLVAILQLHIYVLIKWDIFSIHHHNRWQMLAPITTLLANLFMLFILQLTWWNSSL